MRAARIAGPKHFEILETDAPVAQDGQCLVKVERVSVCGSDIRHGYHVGPEEIYPMEIGRPCHEVAGTIVESRTDDYHEGQRVLLLPTAGTGGLQEYFVTTPSRIIPLPDEGPLDEWVMCQPSGTVLYACQEMPNLLGKNVLIFGQGSIGLSFTMITSRLGARSVIVVDPLDHRLETSKEFGSTHRINPDRENVEEAAAAVTGGIGPDVVVEASGYPDTFNQCLRVAPPFGTIIVFGLMSEHHVTVEHELIVLKQLRIIGTNSARLADATAHIKEIVALRQRGWCDPGKLITHRMGLSDVQKAYDMYEHHDDQVIKVVMNVNE